MLQPSEKNCSNFPLPFIRDHCAFLNFPEGRYMILYEEIDESEVELVSTSYNFFSSSLFRRQNKLVCLSLAIYSVLSLFAGNPKHSITTGYGKVSLIWWALEENLCTNALAY